MFEYMIIINKSGTEVYAVPDLFGGYEFLFGTFVIFYRWWDIEKKVPIYAVAYNKYW